MPRSRSLAGYESLQNLGHQLRFYSRSVAATPRALTHYRRQTLDVLSDVAFGRGGLALVGGTVGVMIALAYAIGAEVALQSHASLVRIGATNFAAFLSAYFNTREAAPLIAGIALAATIGCGFTAQLGAMRISEEIDAIEVMGIRSLPYLVSTRMAAAGIAVVPLYAIGLFSSYLATRMVTVTGFGQSSGTYDHYFTQYLAPVDVLWSFLKVFLFAIAIILIHCYYGFFATGGPAGVGIAVGRAIRTSIVALTLGDFFISFAIWGSHTTVRITG
ncbi:ABC transporter permease [Nocardioides baekrokdamisoli]|uniref:ABC transporter permease n=1 Tax=Nocardioides baekrokdamisoli TaxID=1804624 RepID=A0A3G9IU75_9ACTN|nr:ABC transporter permease [Nocardioides baekrokdamisoli]BBH15733.1 ABC transporter permease [Nocardioides baekrokdamisoli]